MPGNGEIPRVLSIAGSDSGGGAGIQADLKAFAACRVHGMTAITAITAQNTVGVEAIEAISAEMILAQVRAVARDIGVDAVKVGMLGSTQTIAAVAVALAELRAENPGLPIVVDPVMVSETGAALLAVGRPQRADHPGPVAGDGRHSEPARGACPDRQRRACRAGAACPRRPRARPPDRRRHGWSPGTGDRSLRRRRTGGGDCGRAVCLRRIARLGMHPFVGARRPAGVGGRSADRGAGGQAGGWRGGPRRAARDRARTWPGQRPSGP